MKTVNLNEIWGTPNSEELLVIALNNSYCKCLNIQTNKIDYFSIHELLPIKINDNWLKRLKFSFEKDAQIDGWFSLPLLNVNTNVHQFRINKKNKNGEYYFIMDESTVMKIEFVHELQRLFNIFSGGRKLTVLAADKKSPIKWQH